MRSDPIRNASTPDDVTPNHCTTERPRRTTNETSEKTGTERPMNTEPHEAAITETLQRAFPADASQLQRLRDRLASEAQTEHILDVAYRIVDTPIGPLLLAATDVGLVRVAFAIEDHDRVLQDLSDTIGPRILLHPARLDVVARELDEYFAHRRNAFTVNLDWRLSKGFRSEVLHHLPEIAYGRTASYAEVAQLAGRPKAVRAVGTACATNPLPVIVPCHRVGEIRRVDWRLSRRARCQGRAA